MNLVYSGGFFGDKDIESEVEESYKFYINLILKFESIFNYSIDINSILSLPYCLFQDLIIHGLDKKKRESTGTTNLIKEIKLGKRK